MSNIDEIVATLLLMEQQERDMVLNQVKDKQKKASLELLVDLELKEKEV